MCSDIVLFVGLPGSGKTHNANKYCDVVIDDIVKISELPSSEQLGTLRMGITDVNFCDTSILNKAIQKLEIMYPARTIETVYFQNDVDNCIANVQHRDDGRNVQGTIDRFKDLYNPPPDALPIRQPKSSSYYVRGVRHAGDPK